MKQIVCIIILIAAATIAQAGDLAVGKFSSGDLAGWHDKIFKGKTSYSLVTDEGRIVLKAHSVRAASGLVKELKLDAKKYPVLRWRWKVNHSLKKEDVTKKTGDDFAARVYVIFPRTFFWRMRAITYVWSGKMPKDSAAPSPYTDNSRIIAVESGDEKAGQWMVEERNIYADYKRLFGEEPPQVGGIAVMSDTDDTEDDVTAWFGDINLGNATPDKETPAVPLETHAPAAPSLPPPLPTRVR